MLQLNRGRIMKNEENKVKTINVYEGIFFGTIILLLIYLLLTKFVVPGI